MACQQHFLQKPELFAAVAVKVLPQGVQDFNQILTNQAKHCSGILEEKTKSYGGMEEFCARLPSNLNNFRLLRQFLQNPRYGKHFNFHYPTLAKNFQTASFLTDHFLQTQITPPHRDQFSVLCGVILAGRGSPALQKIIHHDFNSTTHSYFLTEEWLQVVVFPFWRAIERPVALQEITTVCQNYKKLLSAGGVLNESLLMAILYFAKDFLEPSDQEALNALKNIQGQPFQALAEQLVWQKTPSPPLV